MHCNLCWDNSSYPGLSSSYGCFIKWFVASDTNVWEWKDAKVKKNQKKNHKQTEQPNKQCTPLDEAASED